MFGDSFFKKVEKKTNVNKKKKRQELAICRLLSVNEL